jgi:hypothetical protein
MLASAHPLILLIPYLFAGLAALCLWAMFGAARRQRLVEDIPTSKTTGVFIGYVEVQGTAEAEAPLKSYLAGVRCVQYQWYVQEHWSRTVTETYTDSQGRTQTRTKHECGWTTVDQGGQMIPFYLRDDCGVIRIDPQGATIEPAQVFNQTCGRSDPLYYGKGPGHSIADSDYRRQFVECAVELHRELYVLGQARERADVVAAEIAADPCVPLFLISTRSEEQVRSGYQWAYWGWLILGGILTIAGWIILDLASGREFGAYWPIYLLAATLYLLLATLVWLWMVFNSLVELRQRVRQAWAQVDVQLKRRHDLIPNLVSIVQGLRDHEQELQADLAELRTQLTATPPGQIGPDYHGMTHHLMAIAERYPELKSRPSFARLHENLVDTEHRIALARSYFNDIASYYNTRLQRVPDRYAAALASLRPQPLLTAMDFEREPVKVTLAVD